MHSDRAQLCSPTSGGHFNPGVTIAFVILKKFPKRKAVRYVALYGAQFSGADLYLYADTY